MIANYLCVCGWIWLIPMNVCGFDVLLRGSICARSWSFAKWKGSIGFPVIIFRPIWVRMLQCILQVIQYIFSCPWCNLHEGEKEKLFFIFLVLLSHTNMLKKRTKLFNLHVLGPTSFLRGRWFTRLCHGKKNWPANFSATCHTTHTLSTKRTYFQY